MYLLTIYLVFFSCILEIVLDSRDKSVNERKSIFSWKLFLNLFEYCVVLF